MIILDSVTLGFITFFVGVFIGVIVPALTNLDPDPNVQRGVQIFIAFMAILISAVAGGAIAAPAMVIGILAGYAFAVQAKANARARMLEAVMKAKGMIEE